MRENRAVDDLVTWLRAQLDDDERVARAVEDRSAPWDGQWVNDGGGALRTYNGWVLVHNAGQLITRGLLDHIARHDPARVLAEVDAKRRILDRWKDSQDNALPPEALLALDEVVKLLALPYADRPGYRDEWRPA
ncbi:DUF6221 family protein [Micromonospora sp. WMMC250]|uniref:DUF6221 family protein n=1 Tax=Micromonospora sp. WMMC250 TaxID=3014781 RepID=UPI0022B6C367|nr:DUF6221 family protein [Micromonospora sp. WMMC250]MCZ7376532.1 DUF6221 family protein [Micromonospora sp. WMMC250]